MQIFEQKAHDPVAAFCFRRCRCFLNFLVGLVRSLDDEEGGLFSVMEQDPLVRSESMLASATPASLSHRAIATSSWITGTRISCRQARDPSSCGSRPMLRSSLRVISQSMEMLAAWCDQSSLTNSLMNASASQMATARWFTQSSGPGSCFLTACSEIKACLAVLPGPRRCRRERRRVVVCEALSDLSKGGWLRSMGLVFGPYRRDRPQNPVFVTSAGDSTWSSGTGFIEESVVWRRGSRREINVLCIIAQVEDLLVNQAYWLGWPTKGCPVRLST